MGIEIIKRLCSVPGCKKMKKRNGMCGMHFRRWDIHGAATRGNAFHGQGEAYLRSLVGTEEQDCVIWPFGGGAYGNIKFDGKGMTASRAMTIIAHGPPPFDGAESAHSCGQGHVGCVNPNHLRWKTRAENMAEYAEHRRKGIEPGHRDDRTVGALRREMAMQQQNLKRA